MSPAVWILVFFLVVLLGTPVVVILLNAESESDIDTVSSETNVEEDTETETETVEEDSSQENGDSPSDNAKQEPAEPSENDTKSNGAESTKASDQPGEVPSENDRSSTRPWSYARKYEQPIVFNDSNRLGERINQEFDPEQQEIYNDRDDPDPSSQGIQSAVEWLVEANTEAIHQQSKFEDFLGHLRSFVDEPRAAGAEAIAQTPWRDQSPNLSRLIGERLLVMALGLSASGPYEMDAHRTAFRELLAETWNDDGLDHPLVYQGIGRLGLLTDTPFVELKENLVERIPGRTPRSNEPNRLEMARFHALILAVSTEEGYPFPRSERGLSRLWHWDEHNPPLANWMLLPTALFALWIHHASMETESDAANDFGALLGNWWDENNPDEDFFRDKPAIWEALLLTAWVLLPDHQLIWNQIEDRYEALNLEPGGTLQQITTKTLDWVDHYDEFGERPESSPSRDNLPPAEWLSPLPSGLVNDYSQPSFDFPEEWCEGLSNFPPERQNNPDY